MTIVVSDNEGELDDFSFGKKKKKKVLPKALETTEVVDTDDQSKSDTLIENANGYDYYSLLSRGREKMVNQKDQKTVLSIPALVVEPEGTTKTTWRNITQVATRLKRDRDHIKAYVTSELATEGTFDLSGALTLRGRFRLNQFQTVVRHYVSEYVKCTECTGHDTDLIKIKGQTLSFIKCNNCHSQKSVAAISKGFRATTKKDRVDEKKKSQK